MELKDYFFQALVSISPVTIIFITIIFVLILLVFLYLLPRYLFYIKPVMYTPNIKTSISIDGGKIYFQNSRRFPVYKYIFFKYEVNVKTRGYWWLFFEKKVEFVLEYPVFFELCEYTNITQINEKYPIEFSVIVSNRPQKTEIIFRLPYSVNQPKDNFEVIKYKFFLKYKSCCKYSKSYINKTTLYPDNNYACIENSETVKQELFLFSSNSTTHKTEGTRS